MVNQDKVRILFIAISYAPLVLPSDKQFLNDLIAAVPESFLPSVWTLTEATPGYKVAQIGNRSVPVMSRCRLGHHPISKRGEILTPHPTHNQLRQKLEIALSIIWESRHSLQEIIQREQPQIIHFDCDIGPILGILRARFPAIIFTCSKPSVRIQNSANWSLYSRLLSYTYLSADKVIAYTDLCRKTLQIAGVPEDKVVTIPWGIKQPSSVPSARIADIRQRYGCSAGNLLVVVLPRGGERFTIDMIRQTKSWGSTASTKIVFAIRPTRYSFAYDGLGNDSVIVENGPSDFYELLAASDVAFAPQEKQMMTSLPPLAWLEAMGRGSPLITMENPGVNDLVIDGQTGFLYRQPSEIPGFLTMLSDQEFRTRLSGNAKNRVAGYHSVDNIAIHYVKTWQSLLSDSPFL